MALVIIVAWLLLNVAFVAVALIFADDSRLVVTQEEWVEWQHFCHTRQPEKSPTTSQTPEVTTKEVVVPLFNGAILRTEVWFPMPMGRQQRTSAGWHDSPAIEEFDEAMVKQ